MNEQNQPTQQGSSEPQQSTMASAPLGVPQAQQPPQAPTPFAPTTAQVPQQQAPKKSKLPLIIAMIVIIIALIGAVAFLLLSKKTNEPASTENNTPAAQQPDAAKEPVTAEATITALEAKAVELHKKQSVYSYEVDQKDETFDPTAGIVFYRPSGAAYAVRSKPQQKGAFNHSTYITVNGKKQATDATNKQALATQQAIIDYLVGPLGFSKLPDPVVIEFPIETLTYTTYKNGSVYCTLPDADQLFGITANCASEESALASANEVAPLYALYAKATTPKAKLYGGTTEKSGKNGYKILELATEVNHVTFVKSATATDWKYAKPTRYQSLPNCTDFEYDNDVRMAFEGTSCARNNKESNVTAK